MPKSTHPFLVPCALALTALLATGCVWRIPAPAPTPTAAPSPSAAATTRSAATAPSRPTLADPRGAFGHIHIPSLGIEAPIVPVSWRLEQREGQTVGVWDTVEGAVGYHLGSAPLGGGGNCVLSGHSRSEEGGVFYGLWELAPGDQVVLTAADGAQYVYLVREVVKVRELGAALDERLAHAVYMDPTDEPRLTLITCWPDWAYTHRVIVIAAP